MDANTFVSKVRDLSTTVYSTARTALYTEVLTALHDEAIFLPLTAKRQTAVTSTSVSGFQFGYMEYDLPLANLFPTPPPPPPPPTPPFADDDDDLPTWALALIIVFSVLFVVITSFTVFMFIREKKGMPIFNALEE